MLNPSLMIMFRTKRAFYNSLVRNSQLGGSKMNTRVVMLLLLVLPTNLISGEYGADFLRIGIGARALGMGGAYVALADDGAAPFWNPAGLIRIPAVQVNLSHAPLFNGLAQHNYANVSAKLDVLTAIAVSWIRMEVNDIPRYGPLAGTRFDRIRDPALRSNGQADGFFGDTEQAFMLSAAHGLDFDLAVGGGFAPVIIPARFSVGVNLKYIRQALDESVGSGQGVDVGLLLQFYRNRENISTPGTFSIGFAIKDIFGTVISWNTLTKHRDSIPLNVSFGVAYSDRFPGLGGRLTLSFHRDKRLAAAANIGSEYAIKNFLALRIGLQEGQLTAGAGIRIYKFNIDYAFTGYELGNTHRISGAVTF